MNEDENALWRGFESRLERVEDVVQELDVSLRGDRRRKIIGLLADWDRHDEALRRLNAVVLGDAAGSKGMAHDVDLLMDRRSGKERRSDFIWKNWIPTLLALLALGLTILTNWDQIKQRFPTDHPGPLEKKIEQAKHPKGKTLYKVHHVPAEAPSESTKESPPN